MDDPDFRKALSNTVYYTVGHVPLTMAVGLFAALLLNQKVRGTSLFRTLFYTPNVTPYVAASIIWLYVLNPDWGLLNWFLSLLRLPTPSWLGYTRWAMPGLIIFSVWKGMGYYMIVYLAGLQSVPEEIYEAARIDGAKLSYCADDHAEQGEFI